MTDVDANKWMEQQIFAMYTLAIFQSVEVDFYDDRTYIYVSGWFPECGMCR